MAILEEAFGRAVAVKEAVVREVKRPPVTTDMIHSLILNIFGLYQQVTVQYSDILTSYSVICERTDRHVTLSLKDIQLQVGYDKDTVPFELSVLPRTEKPLLPKDTSIEGVCLPLTGGVYRVVSGISIVDKDASNTLRQLKPILDKSTSLLERFVNLPTPGVD